MCGETIGWRLARRNRSLVNSVLCHSENLRVCVTIVVFVSGQPGDTVDSKFHAGYMFRLFLHENDNSTCTFFGAAIVVGLTEK